MPNTAEELPLAVEWSRYQFRNEEAREAYYAERDTIDERYRRRERGRAQYRAKKAADRARAKAAAAS